MTRTEARSFGENTLRPMGYEFWVDNKKNDAVGGEGSGSPAAEPMSEPAAPVSRKSKKKHAEEPAIPSEPAVPSGETWGNPKTSEPATPSGETWGTPKTEEPATPPPSETTAPIETPAPKTPVPKPPTPSAPASTAPAKSAPGDTGKVNLDEW